MFKAVKKLKKYWLRKKRRKKTHYIEPYYLVPPPTLPCRCSHSTPVEPSAPPLPPWLDLEQTHQAISASGMHPLPELLYSSQTQLFTSQEIVVETNPNHHPTLPAYGTTESYQQYMVPIPNPLNGVPVQETQCREKRSGGFFGCFASFAANLIRCFCPCFHIREIH